MTTVDKYKVLLVDSSGNPLITANGVKVDIQAPLGRKADTASVSAALSTEDVALFAGLDSAAFKVSLYGKNAAAGDTVLNARVPANGDSLLAGLIANAVQRLYNGSTLDLATGNQDLTVLASAARTVQTNSADFTNYNCRGVIFYLNITAASGTGGLQLVIQGKDPISGNYYAVNATPTAVTNISTRIYVCYVGASGAGGVSQNTSQPLPRVWRVQVQVGDASSYTYSVGATLIM